MANSMLGGTLVLKVRVGEKEENSAGHPKRKILGAVSSHSRKTHKGRRDKKSEGQSLLYSRLSIHEF